MKGKRLLLCALLAALIMISGCALAEVSNRPTDPNADSIARIAAELYGPWPNDWSYGSLGLAVQDDGVYLTGPTTWTVTAEEPGSYNYQFALVHDNDRWPDSGDVVFNKYGTTDPVWSFQIMVPDDYILYVTAWDDAGNVGQVIHEFTVTNPDYPTLDTLVQNVVDECRAAGVTGDYDTAVWLHDWLVDNCEYDYSFLNHSAEAAFTIGTGVCDTYSKAYQLLLEAAGIDAGRAIGYDLEYGGSHAWNYAKLEGEWTQIDVTWDDTVSEYLSGTMFEAMSHSYFGLPDTLMQTDHLYGTESPACDSHALYYLVRHPSLISDLLSEIRDLANDALGAGCYAFGFEEPDYIPFGNLWYSKDGLSIYRAFFDAAAQVVSRDGGVEYAGEPIDVDIAYSVGNGGYTGSVRFAGHTLTLPEELVEIGEQAFENARGVMAVILPANAVTIGPRAFAGLDDLWKVAIPATVEDIDATAFEDCGDHLAIACESGSAAWRFAQENDIPCVME